MTRKFTPFEIYLYEHADDIANECIVSPPSIEEMYAKFKFSSTSEFKIAEEYKELVRELRGHQKYPPPLYMKHQVPDVLEKIYKNQYYDPTQHNYEPYVFERHSELIGTMCASLEYQKPPNKKFAA